MLRTYSHYEPLRLSCQIRSTDPGVRGSPDETYGELFSACLRKESAATRLFLLFVVIS